MKLLVIMQLAMIEKKQNQKIRNNQKMSFLSQMKKKNSFLQLQETVSDQCFMKIKEYVHR